MSASMTFSQRAVEAAARAAYEHEPIEKIDLTEIPWDDLTEGVRDRYRHKAQSALTAALAMDGVVLVPVEPTSAMIEAGCENNPTQWNEGTDLGFAADVANDVYRAMLSAASEGEERNSPPQDKP